MKPAKSRATLWKAKRRERPEDKAGAGEFYSGEEGKAHRESNAVANIQRRITARAMELAGIVPPCRVLDAGCGSGFSTQALLDAGFEAAGFDADERMVAAAKKKGLDVRNADLRNIPFEDKSFDAIISISALQWLGAGKKPADAFLEYHACATEFFRVLKKGGKAVVQFYPKDEREALLAGSAFVKAGLKGRLQVDSADNPTRRKVFLVLQKA